MSLPEPKPTAAYLQSSGPTLEHAFIADDRLQISPIENPLKLAEKNEISIKLGGYTVRGAVAEWDYYIAENSGNSHPLEESATLAVRYGADGGAILDFLPNILGKIELRIIIVFEDGGIASKRVNAKVVLPERKPEKLIVAEGGGDNTRNAGRIFLDISATDHRTGIIPMAYYKDVPKPFHLQPRDVVFRVIDSADYDPAIDFNTSTGGIVARHVGHALIETRFEGLSNLTCVVVSDGPLPAQPPDCHELRPPGSGAIPVDGHRSEPPTPVRPHVPNNKG
jgi:hypothetical protein